MSEILTAAINGLPVSTVVDIRFFDTGHDEPQASEDGASSENSDTKMSEGFHSNTSNASIIGVQRGRPDLQKILNEEIELATETISVNGASQLSMTVLCAQLLSSSVWQSCFSQCFSQSVAAPSLPRSSTRRAYHLAPYRSFW